MKKQRSGGALIVAAVGLSLFLAGVLVFACESSRMSSFVPVTATATGYVDPADPASAFLVREHVPFFGAAMVFGAFFTVLGILLRRGSAWRLLHPESRLDTIGP